ncbi:TetR family transcriptional regulator [Phyllobacterium sp. 21LDTY02-6]|uniref:TetR/AcrR family transcriptional regulator n=1 Tax=Phyllobacterium sp. 21LDTY02-6 TaxID=2944903 RepID=UPI002021436C|nr:TetR/AcrR family transcriptional regulator [Phyllobacterium sp. 21LDTY02-6]MCO4319575.1 TetR family transcriptional regulator [Phyllobacterium sp. 21LDTY02-6]
MNEQANPEAAARREPTQQRSRDRVERILLCATRLIEQGGSDAMRMSDVAAQAGISIGSLYQYFPDKAAIIRTLAERYNQAGQACIAEALQGADDEPALLRAFGELIDTYYAMFLAEPVMRDIWSGTQADKALRNIDIADSRVTGGLLADARARVSPGADRQALEQSSFLLMQLGEATMRLAISVEREEGDRLVGCFKHMALRELASAARKGLPD